MKCKNLLSLLLTIQLNLTLSACNSNGNNKHTEDLDNQSSQKHTQNHSEKHSEESNPTQAEKDFQSELDGLTKLQNEIQKGEFESGKNDFENLHEAFHTSVIPPVEKKNPNLAEDMHSKFDALEDSINKKEKTQAIKMVDANRQNILQAGKELGLSLK
jgi:molecular chaperone GrpE (heat shock protein)